MSVRARASRSGTLEERRGPDGAVCYVGRLRLADGSKSGRMPVPAGLTRAQAARWLAGQQAREDAEHMVFKAKLDAAREQAAAERAPAPHGGELVDTWFARYLASKTCGEGHRVKTGYQWKKWVSPVLGAKPVATLTRDDLEEVRDHLDRAIVLGKVRAKTLATVWGHVTSAMGAAANAKDRTLRVHAVPPGSPGLHAGILPPTPGTSRKRPWLYPSEWSALMACEAVPLAWRRLYAVALYTGLRPGELRVLTWGDVDLHACTVTVSKAWDDATRTVKAPKTEAGRRTFPIVAPLVAMLEAMRGEPTELVVPEYAQGEERIAQRFRRHLAAAQVTRARLTSDTDTEEPADFRSLRDSFATWCALAGLATSALQRRMGHESPATTDGYVKQAEDVTAGSIGAPFPPLLAQLLAQEGPTKAKSRGVSRAYVVARVGFESRLSAPTPAFLDGYGVLSDETPPERQAITPPSGPVMAQQEGTPATGRAVAIEGASAPHPGAGPRPWQAASRAAADDASATPPTTSADVLEHALAVAISEAAKAGQWAIVSQLGRELEARRLASLPNVVPIGKRLPG